VIQIYEYAENHTGALSFKIKVIFAGKDVKVISRYHLSIKEVCNWFAYCAELAVKGGKSRSALISR